jgi:hypothetical protein
MHFMRLWTSAASLMHDLAKSRFVMEAAGGRSTAQTIQRVYERLIEGIYGPLDAILAGEPPALPEPDSEPGAVRRLTTLEESLAEWILEATPAVGGGLAGDALRLVAQQAGAPEAYWQALGGLAEECAEGQEQGAEPWTLADRLTALGDLMSREALAGGFPDVEAIRRRLEEERGG